MIPAEIIAEADGKAIFDVARQCGAELRKAGSEWNGPCPACGGHDRFWLNEGKNVFLCRMSGASGGPINLIRHKHQCGFPEAVEMLTGARAMPAGERRAPAEPDNEYRDKARRRAYRIWRDGAPVEPERHGRLVAAYFEQRAIPFPRWHIRTLREARDLPYWRRLKSKQDHVIIHRGPAMLAAVTGPDGHFIGVHRTWLDPKQPNGKAEIFDPETGEQLAAKKVEGSQRGGKIALREGFTERTIAIGEGIETLLSWDIGRERQAQLWAGINLDNIAGKALAQIPHPTLTVEDSLGRKRRVKVGGPEPDPKDRDCLQIPPGAADRVILLGDADSDAFTTQAAMQRAVKRIAAPGLDVSIDWAPDGMDWNDVARASRAAAQGVAA